MRAAAAWVVLAALAAGCGKETEPTAGTLMISLVTPNVDDGALRLTVYGGRIGVITAADPAYRLFIARPDSSSAHIIVTGPVAAGPLLRIDVPDAGLVSSYGATVQEAAARTTFESRVLTGYATTVAQE